MSYNYYQESTNYSSQHQQQRNASSDAYYETSHQVQSTSGPGHYGGIVTNTNVVQHTVIDLNDSEDTFFGNRRDSEFSDRSRRMAFIRKVLGTVALQLVFCSALTAGFVFSDRETKVEIRKYYWVAFICLIVWLVLNIAVVCCGAGRGPPNPTNISLLIFGTFCLSVACAFITVGYERDVILYALASTVVILLIIIVLTVFTPLDITGCGIYICVAGIVVLIAALVIGLVLALSPLDRETRRMILLVLSFVFVLLFSMYILYDIQIIIGGKGRFHLNEEDWLFACFILFGDIIFLFLKLLELFNILQAN